jgi:glycosyltransferase involved in cell wall biosynthesis
MTRRTIAIMGRSVDQDDGIGIYTYQLCKAMFSLDSRTRYLMLLMTPKYANAFNEYRNVEVHVAPARSKLIWDQWITPRLARKLGAQLIFNPKFSIPLFTRLPCVFVQQGSDWYVNPQNYLWWDNLYIRLMLPLYSRKATRLASISQATLNELHEYGGIDSRDAKVTYAGVAANFTPERKPEEIEQFKRDYRLPERYIFTVARTLHGGLAKLPDYPGGNTERLMRAYRKYREAGGSLPLVVAGIRVEEYLRARGFGDEALEGVQFLGFVPNARIHVAYQLAECFILATLCESFGIPIVEAFATGCPAIVPNTCASPEIAGGAARLINPRDEDDMARALIEVTGSAQLREELRRKGLARASFFSWRATAQRTLELLEEVLPPEGESPIASAYGDRARRDPSLAP